MARKKSKIFDYVKQIAESGLSIYDPINIGDPELWIPTQELETLLGKGLTGLNLTGLPIRTRSKVVKARVCESLGYPVPTSFRRSKPRFLGQLFDTYVQKANNLQIWNEQLSGTRRYVLIRVSLEDLITDVRVVTGADLALLDTTGTLTQKYQARFEKSAQNIEQVSSADTENMRLVLADNTKLKFEGISPTEKPQKENILPITEVFARIKGLVGATFAHAGHDQERNRGAGLHKLVCKALGFGNYLDDGRFPDVRHQLIEIKLQTAATIDLGLVLPSSTEPLDIVQIDGHQIRHCDIRYAVFGASSNGETVTITDFVLTTGKDFFGRFPQFQGKVLNQKLQISLPKNFFRSESK